MEKKNAVEENSEPQKQPAPLEKGPIRFGWEIFHRLLGVTLLGFTWWQVQDGLGLLATRFGKDNLDTVFWIVDSCNTGSIGVLAIYSCVAL